VAVEWQRQALLSGCEMSNLEELVRERKELIEMIRDSVEAVVPVGGDLRRIRSLRFTIPGFDRGTWNTMANMGWLGLRISEDDGGSGLGMQEYCALLEGLGRGLVPEPILFTSISANVLKGEDLSKLLDGSQIILPAWQEKINTLAPVGSTHCLKGKITGRKILVPMAEGADAFIISTPEGLLLVDRHSAGLSIQSATTQDGGHFGTLIFNNVQGEPLEGHLDLALEEAALATSAYLLGVTDRAFEMTLSYMQDRKQFGKPIGSFQALQHRLVDLKIQISLLRASVENAAMTLDNNPNPTEAKAAVSLAKARASEVSMLIGRQAIQLHGAIGYTDEYDVGLYLRKAMTFANLFGSAEVHRNRFAQCGLDL